MAQAAPAPQPTAYGVPANHTRRMSFTITIPSEVVMIAEDMAQSQGMTLANWIQEYCVRGLELQLGG